jgi:hypothetical protein
MPLTTKTSLKLVKSLDLSMNQPLIFVISTVSHSTYDQLTKWVASRVRDHLTDVLHIARTCMGGFDLSDHNTTETNQYNFGMATCLSTYLHLHHLPQSPQGQRVSFPMPTTL